MLLIDELDASLHPRFAAEVVRLFHDPSRTPRARSSSSPPTTRRCCTTPSGGRLLDPGQVWLTQKDEDGATELYPLTAAEPGEEEDLTQSYLAGAFGGVPALLEGQIARRLPRRPRGSGSTRRSGRELMARRGGRTRGARERGSGATRSCMSSPRAR